ncbi:MAG TPA: hypothetical protein VFU88_05235 [Ktedonobacterales bacterium]|nr:hypothetical protein [Ktedonobacterales bacterium]
MRDGLERGWGHGWSGGYLPKDLRHAGTRGWWRGLLASVALLAVLAMTLAGCSGSSSKTTSANPGLTTLSWCDRPYLNFVDASSSAQTPINDWTQVKSQLGFTLYLPPSLPKGSCLALAGGSIHDPIYGAHVSLTWDVAPDMQPLSFSEAPKRGADAQPQCQASAQDAKVAVCLGTIANTSITVVARKAPADLQAIYATLKPNVEWLPSNTQQSQTTPTTTSTGTPTA